MSRLAVSLGNDQWLRMGGELLYNRFYAASGWVDTSTTGSIGRTIMAEIIRDAVSQVPEVLWDGMVLTFREQALEAIND